MCEALIKSIEVNQKKIGFTVLDAPSQAMVNKAANFFKEKNILSVYLHKIWSWIQKKEP